jgi:putative transposase
MSYPSDWSEAEWDFIKNEFEPPSKRGSGHKHSKKSLVDAILYVLKGGIPWRWMPNDFPCWQTVYDHFSQCNKRGVWEHCLDRLNAFRRQQAGRNTKPSYGIIDAQSVKTQ